MCDVCCKEFRGWCKSFTKTEIFLSVLECVLLVIFAVLLGFIILHFLVCSKKDTVHEYNSTLTYRPENANAKCIPEKTETSASPHTVTITSHVQCTWKESEKTEAATHYYEIDKMDTSTTSTTSIMAEIINTTSVTSQEFIDFSLYLSDEEDDDENAYKDIVLALVKIRPSQNTTFGCILVKITRYWTLSAASCIQAIEKVDSLDNYVIIAGYGEPRRSRTHPVADVRIHPLFRGRSYDVVALRSEHDLGETANLVTLPTTLDYYFTTIGERLTLLGYEQNRRVEPRRARRGLRATSVWVATARRCGGGAAATAMCGVPRQTRARPGACCGGIPLLAGSPLLAGRRLLAVMADDRRCGEVCEPALFVNLAVASVRGWLDAVLAA